VENFWQPTIDEFAMASNRKLRPAEDRQSMDKQRYPAQRRLGGAMGRDVLGALGLHSGSIVNPPVSAVLSASNHLGFHAMLVAYAPA